MTLQRIVEELAVNLPNISRTRLIYDVNQALYEYCQETGVIVQRLTLTITSYIGENSTKGYFEYHLPADVYEIIDVDSAFQGDFEIYDGDIRFKFYPPRTDEHPIIHYSRVPTALVDLTDSPEIPTSLHRALISAVLWSYWSRQKETLAGAQAERINYQEYIRRGIKMANTFRHRNTAAVPYTGTEVTPGVTANNIAYGTKSLADGLNTITFADDNTGGPDVFSDTDFRIVLNGNGVVVEEYEKTTTRTTGSFQVISAGDNPNFEYLAVGAV